MKQLVLAAALTVATAGGWVAVMPPAPVAQPIAFNHAAHAPMACRVCHTGVESGARAQLPGAATCAKCHATAPGAIGVVRWTAMQESGAPVWIRVTRAPDHVRFSHHRHVTLGQLECASCHGGIGTAVLPPVRAPLRLDMDACVSCHRREAVNDDCAGCHR
jgi:hypothetical protein